MSVEEPEIGLFTLTRDADADALGQVYDLNDLGFDHTFLSDAHLVHQQSYPILYSDADFQALFEMQTASFDDTSSEWSTLTEYDLVSPRVPSLQQPLLESQGSAGLLPHIPAYLPPPPPPNPLGPVPYPAPLDADTPSTSSDWSTLTEYDALPSPQLASLQQPLFESQGSAVLLPHVPAYLPPTPAGPNPLEQVPHPTPFPLEPLSMTELELASLLLQITQTQHLPPPPLPFTNPPPSAAAPVHRQLAPASSQAPSVSAASDVPTPTVVGDTTATANANVPAAPSPPAAQRTRPSSSRTTDLGTLHAPSLTCFWASCTTHLARSSFPTQHAFEAQADAHLAAHERGAPRTQAPDGRWRWRCEWEGCGRTFCDRRALGRHLRSNRHVVGGVRVRFECAVCGRAWTRKGERDTHFMRMHGGQEGGARESAEVEVEEGPRVKRRRV